MNERKSLPDARPPLVLSATKNQGAGEHVDIEIVGVGAVYKVTTFIDTDGTAYVEVYDHLNERYLDSNNFELREED